MTSRAGEHRLTGRRRVALLAVILAAVAFGVAWVAILVLDRLNLDVRGRSLAATLAGRAGLAEALAAEATDEPAAVIAAVSALASLAADGAAGDMVVARRDGENVEYLLAPGHSLRELSRRVTADPALAEPLRRALAGQAGTMVGQDYEGRLVLAAYQPATAYRWGLVLKVDLEAARAPFRRAAWLAGGAAALLAGLGALLFIGVARPIVRTLEDNEAALRSAFDQAAVGLAHVALDGRYLRVNARFSEITGYPPAELLRRSFRDLTHPDDLESGRDLDGKLLSGEIGEYRGEVRYTDAAGRTVWVSLAVALVRSADGAPRHFVAAISDVTARRDAQERVARLNRLLHTIRKVNLLLGRIHDRRPLVEEVCRILVADGGFAGARVTLARNGHAPMSAWCGAAWRGEEASPAGLPAEGGFAPSGGGTVLATATSLSAHASEGAASAAGAGLLSVAVTPLLVSGSGGGALAVAATGAGSIDAEIVGMLEEIASDLGVGLRGIALEGQRLAAEQALRDSEARFRATFEMAAIGMTVTAPGGRLLMANDAFAAMVGRDRQTLLAGDWQRITHPDDVEASARNVRALLAGDGATARFEKRYLRPDGGVVVAEISTHLVRDDAGAPLYFVTHAADVTDSRRAQDELRTLGAAIEQAADPIIITAVDGTIQYVNPAFERVTGYSRFDAVGSNPRFLKSGAHDDAFYRAMWETLGRGDVWHGRFVNRRKDGSLYEEEATISPVRDASGRVVSYVATKHDVSEEEHLRSQLAQAQKMEAVGRLAGGIAHDFNNLLQAMLGFAGAWKAQTGAGDADRGRLAELEELIGRGAAITRQLLLFSRRQAVAPRPVDLNEVVLTSARLLRRLLRENVALEVEPAPGPLTVSGDPGQLEQVVMNLAVNAGDAMPAGGRLVLRTARHNGHALLEVCDSGHGIPEAIRVRIFEPFFTTKGAGKGTGLGLSVVHGIVTRHGGSVTVESVEGAGTTFRIELPVERTAVAAVAAAPAAAAASPAPAAGGRICLIEDEATLRDGLAAVLTALGYEVAAVGSGEEALALPAEAAMDLVLTDLSLPGVSGLDAAAELRGRWPSARVVVMSGYPEGSLDPAAAACIHGYLEKPFDMRTLAAALERARAGGDVGGSS